MFVHRVSDVAEFRPSRVMLLGDSHFSLANKIKH